MCVFPSFYSVFFFLVIDLHLQRCLASINLAVLLPLNIDSINILYELVLHNKQKIIISHRHLQAQRSKNEAQTWQPNFTEPIQNMKLQEVPNTKIVHEKTGTWQRSNLFFGFFWARSLLNLSCWSNVCNVMFVCWLVVL